MFLFLNCVLLTQAQNRTPLGNNVVITSLDQKTMVSVNENDELHVNVYHQRMYLSSKPPDRFATVTSARKVTARLMI
jgi:hypothetical protein